MTNYALVRNADDQIVGLANYADALSRGWTVPPAYRVRLPTADAVIGGAFVPPQEVPLGDAKWEKRFDTNREFYAREGAGYTFAWNAQQRTYDIDAAGIRVIMAVFIRAKAQRLSDALVALNYSDGIDPLAWANVPVRAREGYTALTVKQAWELGIGAFARVAALLGRKGVLELGITAAADQAALNLIDPTTGWP